MAKITITYAAINAPAGKPADQICATFVPTNAAADNAAFDGTYYDTNVAGLGLRADIAKFVTDSVAHPGLVAALKRAQKDGSYEFDTTDHDTIMYYEEVAAAVADQGFTIAVTDGE